MSLRSLEFHVYIVGVYAYFIPACTYLLKVKNRNTRTRCQNQHKYYGQLIDNHFYTNNLNETLTESEWIIYFPQGNQKPD